METEAIRIGVIMQCTPLANRWQPFQWQPIEVVGQVGPAQSAPHCLRNDPADTRWLFTGIDVRLCSTEAEGYFLNISAPTPCWFIMWRFEEVDGVELAVPKSVTLSYNEAARLMDGGERVDTLPASADIVERLTAFTNEYYHPEPKRKNKKPSFEGGEGVAKMASAEGGKNGG
ncbi:DUF3305 domain-containing protein [Herminiimonas sp.]|uniref:DUF3305 domain-containing protein n=1 Tax=Herminiimonas sp. TaxID=1926289 RepID=UPI0027268665|nr:DUF3305 domain-containing protein [Herminiimonas sp.]MDO8306607.1 DUF3305 domain-containing protein [Herminiimonas sp.]